MISIKLPIQNKIDICKLQKTYSSVLRFAYNRFIEEDLNQRQIRAEIKDKFTIGSWLAQCALKEGEAVYKRFGTKKIVFGGKKNFRDYNASRITKLEYQQKRLHPVVIQGERLQNGNRHFKLDIINHNKIIFKLNKSTHIDIILPNLRKSYKQKLYKLEELSSNKEITYQVSLTPTHITLTFEDLDDNSIVLRNKSRILGIDTNPNYIGLSVIEFNNAAFDVLHKETISFKSLNHKSNYSNNKKKHEIIEVCKYIVNIAKHFNCAKIAVEELLMSASNKGLGKSFNRLCNNVWHRDLFNENLKKRCIASSIQIVNINPAYSSFVGNINYSNDTTPDPVAASIEIARRGYNKFRKGWFYPTHKNLNNLTNLWKEDLNWEDMSWVEIYRLFNKGKSKVKYRFLLDDCHLSSFSLFSYKSCVTTLY